MAKRKTKRKIKSEKKPIKKYLIGITLLFTALLIGVLWHSNPLIDQVSRYAFQKRQIQQHLGVIQELSFDEKPYFADTDKVYNLRISLKGQKAEGKLKLKASFKDNTWHFNNIHLIQGEKKISLSSLYIDEANTYAASLSSPKLVEPIFLTGEDIFFEVFLSGINVQNTRYKITESLSLYSSSMDLIVSKPHIATYQNNINNKLRPSIRFTNKLADISPGQYFVKLTFHDEHKKTLESLFQPITIRAGGNGPFVRSVTYYNNSNLDQTIKPEFKPSQNIFLRLSLDGFKVKNSTVAGLVSLKIENSSGELIANQPKFASFNQSFASDDLITINGKLKLTDPDIYLLSFRIKDQLGKAKVIHQEKILVTLSDQ